MPNSRQAGSRDSGEPPQRSPDDASDQELLSELEAVRKEVEELLAAEELPDGRLKSRGASDAQSNRDREARMARTEFETQVELLQQRIDRLEASQRQSIIREAARFAADVRIANGHAPLGRCWDTRGDFEDGVSKYVDAKLKELDQDEANALALELWELTPSEPQEP